MNPDRWQQLDKLFHSAVDLLSTRCVVFFNELAKQAA
jgi:hypothetical protein